MNDPIKLFISYSHKDDELKEELIPHLAGLVKEGLIEPWHDRKISAGADWATEIDDQLELADIILFLVSADFIDSRYCSGIEMARAIKRHQARTACAIPVIIRFSDWTGTHLGKLQAIPRDNKPVSSWGGTRMARDEPWLMVAREIRNVVDRIQKQKNDASTIQKTQAKEEFRAKATEFYRDNVLSLVEEKLLTIERQRLGLEEGEAAEILQMVQLGYQQHQKNLEQYLEALSGELAGKSELSEEKQALLKQLQIALGISDSEAAQALERSIQHFPASLDTPVSD